MRGFELNPLIISLELISLLIIILVCFLIFIKTREIYNLSGHRGIGFFRTGFFFFGIGAIINLMHIIFIFFKIHRELGFNMKIIFIFASIFTLIGLLYLLFSLFSKKIKNDYFSYIFIPIIFLIFLFIKDRYLISLIHIILTIIIIGIIFYLRYKNNNKKFISKIFLIYILLFIFWFLNSIRFWIFDSIIFSREVLSLINCFIFIYIYYLFKKKFLKN